jgi:hypothetical protein
VIIQAVEKPVEGMTQTHARVEAKEDDMLAQFDQFVVHSEMEKQKQVDILKKENNHP